MTKFYQKYPNIDSIKNSNFNTLKLSKEFINEGLKKNQNDFYSEKISNEEKISIKSTKSEIPRSKTFIKQVESQEQIIFNKDFSKKKNDQSQEFVNKSNEGSYLQESTLIENKKKNNLVEQQNYMDNSQRSIVDSRLNYTESFIQLNDHNLSKIERRNKNYNVFNTYSSVRNPKNIITRKDRNNAIKDLIERKSTCSSGMDITILRSDYEINR